MDKHRLNILFILISIFVLVVWYYWLDPYFKKLPPNFSYQANILSLENFYNEKEQKFEGKRVSKSSFSYNVFSHYPSFLMIKNEFAVKKLNNIPIFSVMRFYYINPYSYKHIVIPMAKKREGYLFGPPYANKKPFTYWHVNYDAPARMTFVNKESVEGLLTYHYEAHYVADQTENLTYLPDVPEKKGIQTNVYLQLWIEPISGWLVKYKDDTLAFYYDKKTKKALFPWNQFSNRYTLKSIRDKAKEAYRLKWKYLTLDFLIPIFLLLIILSIYLHLKKANQPLPFTSLFKPWVLQSLIISVLILFTLMSIYYFSSEKPTRKRFKIGLSQWNNNSELIEAIQGFRDGLSEQGFYEGKNLDIYIQNPKASIENQINLIQSFLQEKVDLIFTLSTIGTLVAKGVTAKIPIIFTDVRYPIQSGIIDRTIQNKSNIIGISNYLSPGQQFHQFELLFPETRILGFLHQKGDPDSEFQFQEFKQLLNKRGITVIDIPAIDMKDISKELKKKYEKHHYNALFVSCDSLIRNGGYRFAAAFAKAHRLPSFTCDKESVKHGIMLGHFVSLYETGKLAGIKAAFLLRGADPSWLKTEELEKSYLMLNVITASELGLTISREQLQKADALIKH